VAVLRQNRFLCSRFDLSGFSFGCFYIFGLRHGTSGLNSRILQAPAIEGKANTALRRFLAEKLSIPQRAIVLERGERSRDKVLRIDGLSEEEVRRRMLATI
jgi:uncharacterized protein YggU (UPF0235/DUF167 family)